MDYTQLKYPPSYVFPSPALAVIWSSIEPGAAVLRQGEVIVVTYQNGSLSRH